MSLPSSLSSTGTSTIQIQRYNIQLLFSSQTLIPPHNSLLLPNPNPKVQDSMVLIWRALIDDPKKTVDAHFDAIMSELIKEMGGKLWRSRQAACSALSDLIQGTSRLISPPHPCPPLTPALLSSHPCPPLTPALLSPLPSSHPIPALLSPLISSHPCPAVLSSHPCPPLPSLSPCYF